MHFEITKYYSREELDVLAKKCGLVQRESPITGFTIAVMATTGLLNTPDGTLAQLAAHLSSALQTNVSPQAIDARLGDAAMAFMHCCLEKAFSMAARPPPLVGRDVNLVNDFAHLYIIDSTNFELHPSLKDVFTGSSGASSPSSMRIQLIHDYITGRIYVMIGDTKMCDAPALQNVVDSDILDLSGKCLFLSDLGYFKIDTFKNIHSKEMFFISKLSFGVSLSDASGEKIDLERLMKSSEAFDIPVVIAGSKFRLTGQKLSDADINKRLRKAARSAQCKRGNTISDKYRLFLQYALTLTNLPELFTISALFTVYRLRWQIELIFKAWKSILQIHKIRSARIPRVMCQVYGKLIVAVVSMQIADEGRRLTYLRIYSGRIDEKSDAYNPGRKLTEKISRIFLMHAKDRRRLEEVGAGNIVGVLGLKLTSTGETVCAPAHPIVLESIGSYEPVISIAIETESQADRERLDTTLRRIADEDPTFRFREDPDTGQTVMSGMGELHLDVVADRIRRDFGVPVRVGRPEVVYAETVGRTAEASGICEIEHDETRVFARLFLRVEPAARGVGSTCAVAVGIPLHASLLEAARTGVLDALKGGVLHGLTLTDVQACILGVETREGFLIDETSLKIAAMNAVKEACAAAAPARLEPIGVIEVTCPSESMGEVLGGIQARRGVIEAMEDRGPVKAIMATAPIERMFGYATELRSSSQGRATFSLRFARYDVS